MPLFGPEIDLALVILAGVGLALALVPVVATALGLTRLRFVPSDDPDPVRPAARPGDADYRRKFADLAALGFEPVGMVCEQSWLFMHHWYKMFPVYCLRSPDGTVFASLYRLTGGEPWRIALDTFTTAGGMVRSVFPGAGITSQVDGMSRREYLTADPDQLLALHAEHVAEAVRYLGGTVTTVTLADRAATDQKLEQVLLRQVKGDCGLGWVLMGLGGPAFGIFLLMEHFWNVTTDQWGAIGLAVTLGSLCYGAVAQCVIPAVIDSLASERHPDKDW